MKLWLFDKTQRDSRPWLYRPQSRLGDTQVRCRCQGPKIEIAFLASRRTWSSPKILESENNQMGIWSGQRSKYFQIKGPEIIVRSQKQDILTQFCLILWQTEI